MTTEIAFNELTLAARAPDAGAARQSLVALVRLLDEIETRTGDQVIIHPPVPELGAWRIGGGFSLSSLRSHHDCIEEVRRLQRRVDRWDRPPLSTAGDDVELYWNAEAAPILANGLGVAWGNGWLSVGLDTDVGWCVPRVPALARSLREDQHGEPIIEEQIVDVAHATNIDHLNEHTKIVPAARVAEHRAGIRFIAVCEGKTESLYLHDAAVACGLSTDRFIIEGQAGTPLTVVHRARTLLTEVLRERKRTRGADLPPPLVWAVFDRDEHPFIPRARDTAAGAGIRVAFSNPCFEAWAILHYEGENCSSDRHKAQRHLRVLMPNYDHESGAAFDLDALRGRITNARRRARELREARRKEGDPFGPIYTNIDELLDDIQKAANASPVLNAF